MWASLKFFECVFSVSRSAETLTIYNIVKHYDYGLQHHVLSVGKLDEASVNEANLTDLRAKAFAIDLSPVDNVN